MSPTDSWTDLGMLQKTICIDNIIEKIWVAGWAVAIKADMALQGPLTAGATVGKLAFPFEAVE